MAQLQLNFGKQNRNRVYDSVRPRHPSMRDRIVDLLKANPDGLTRHEVAALVGKHVHQISGRFTELLESKRIIETEETRETANGKPATVCKVQDDQVGCVYSGG